MGGREAGLGEVRQREPCYRSPRISGLSALITTAVIHRHLHFFLCKSLRNIIIKDYLHTGKKFMLWLTA